MKEFAIDLQTSLSINYFFTYLYCLRQWIEKGTIINNGLNITVGLKQTLPKLYRAICVTW
jgi:hypothetical protein